MLAGYKTYITAGLAVLTAAASYLTGEVTAVNAATAALNALMIAFVRNGIKS